MPLPPSVEGALLGTEDRQSRPIDERLRLILRRARPSSLSYALFQARSSLSYSVWHNLQRSAIM